MQSETITRLRFPLAVAVVFIHSFGLPREVDWQAVWSSPLTGDDCYQLVRTFCSYVAPSPAVPLFFLLSGFLFFRRVQRFTASVYVQKLRRRFRTLFVPYMLWNLLSLLGFWGLRFGQSNSLTEWLYSFPDCFVAQGGWHLFWDAHPIGQDSTNWLGLTVYHHAAPIDVPLWFVRDLMVVVLLSPLLFWLLKRLGGWFVALMAALYVVSLWPPIEGLSLQAVFFFTSGGWFALCQCNLVTEMRRVRLVACVSAPLLAFGLLFLQGSGSWLGSLLSPFYVMTGVCALVNLAAWSVERFPRLVPPVCSQASFFIYAAHTLLLLKLMGSLTAHLVPGTQPLAMLVRYFTSPLLTVAVCVAVYALLRAVAPRLLGLFTGDR